MNPLYIETSKYGMPKTTRSSYVYESDFDGGLNYGFTPAIQAKFTARVKEATKKAAKQIEQQKQVQKATLSPLASIGIIALLGLGGVVALRYI